MNRRLRTATAALAIIVTAGFTLSACGDEKKDADSSSSAAGVGEKASTEITEANFAETVAAAQNKARTSHVSMDIGAAGQALKAEGDMSVGKSAAETAMSLKMDMAGMGSLEMRLVDGTVYMNFGQMTGGKFVKADLDDKNNPLGAQYSQLTEQMDPSKQLDLFKKSMTSFSKKGSTKKIDGVDAQPYEIVVDTSKLPGMADLGGTGVEMPKTLTYTMYIGPDNLPRRISSEVMGSPFTVDYSKWGEPVKVAAPSASQVTDKDLAELMSGQLGG